MPHCDFRTILGHVDVEEEDLRARLDLVAEEYRSHPEQSYEAGAMFALVCHRAADSPRVRHSARLLRDAFGTWTHHIHSGGTDQAALEGHACIERALDDWLADGRNDLAGFAEKWKLEEHDVMTDWL